MKKLIKSYFSFTRMERFGLVTLCTFLIILICIRAFMFLWVHPSSNFEESKKIADAWQTFKQGQEIARPPTENRKKDYQDIFDNNETTLPDSININIADSATFVRLKGIGPVTAGKIIAYRKKIGHFNTIDQLLEIRHFPTATFKILKEHLYVQDDANN